MRVLKFGGTSIADAKRFICVADILENNSRQEQIAAVLSAPAKITNHLVSMIDCALKNTKIQSNILFFDVEQIFFALVDGLAILQPGFDREMQRNVVNQEFTQIKQLLRNISSLRYCPDSVNAKIICYGEKLSIMLMQAVLIARGFSVTVINPVEKLLAQGSYLNSTVDIVTSTIRINNAIIPSDHIILMAGFIAGNEHGELVVLGRNGSDYSATVLAACLRADRCEIWTDVDGIYTCDPHQVSDAQLLSSLSYQEAMTLSYFGAKILHPRAIIPIAQLRIPCLIKNTTNPQASGTLIGSTQNKRDNLIKGITYLNNMTMINVSGSGIKNIIKMITRVYAAISRAGSSAILITQSYSRYSISFFLPQNELLGVRKTLEEEFYLELRKGLIEPLKIISRLAIISMVGDIVCMQNEVSKKLLTALKRANVNIVTIVQGLSERSISIIVDNESVITSVQVAHQMLFDIDHTHYQIECPSLVWI